MTDKDLTLIAVLVDRSGSMQTCRDDMQGGLNTFIKEQANQPGKAEITLAQFDNEYELVWPVMDLREELQYTLSPRGSTALLDGMGRFITEVGDQLRQRREKNRPSKVIVCIVTDGQENSSREWRRDKIRELVTQQREQWNWEFVFLGANMDAVAEGMSFGIPRGSTITYTAANAGSTYSSLNNYVAASRSGVAAAFSDDDRKAAVAP